MRFLAFFIAGFIVLGMVFAFGNEPDDLWRFTALGVVAVLLIAFVLERLLHVRRVRRQAEIRPRTDHYVAPTVIIEPPTGSHRR